MHHIQEFHIKKFFYSFLFILFFITNIHADYLPFIKMQLSTLNQMDESNITQEKIKVLNDKYSNMYIKSFEQILLQKRERIDRPKPYQEEILRLKKRIKRNEMYGNKYAVIRDTVRMKSYQIMQTQDKMTKHILRALGKYDYDGFAKFLHEEFVKSQEEVQKITTVEYKSFLQLEEKNTTLKEAQKNIKYYYGILEINADMLNYYAIYEKRVYRLNKYADYRILPIALYLDHSTLGEKLNPLLYPYNLSVMKLLLILFISLMIYLIRTRVYKLIEKLLLKVKHFGKYSQETMIDIRKPINILFMAINLEVVIYIYHNFYSIDKVDKFFNIVYALLFTVILYKTLNAIASIRINDMDQEDKKIKSEMVNVGIKVINFLILILGILLVMHFAGANLTTVLSGLGIGGFAIALAARESLSNFLGTISILMSDTFSQGDWIAVSGEQGTVVEIGLRVTTLRTFDNALIAIPNGTIANQDVKNWSRRTLGRRIKMSLGIKYDSKPKNIQSAISEIREMLETHPNIATVKTDYKNNNTSRTKLVSKEDELGVKRTLLVYLDELSDSSINILVYCFTKTTNWEEWLKTKEDVIFKLMNILEKNELEFAYPSMSLYHENHES